MVAGWPLTAPTGHDDGDATGWEGQVTDHGADQPPAARGERDAPPGVPDRGRSRRRLGLLLAQWLIDLSELPDLLGTKPVRSELIYLLVSLDKQYAAGDPGEPWEPYYARHILSHFRPSGSPGG